MPVLLAERRRFRVKARLRLQRRRQTDRRQNGIVMTIRMRILPIAWL